jgi:hypothetical protein
LRAGQCPAEDIADLLGSVHLMRAVIELGISIPVLEFEFTENMQTAYLVALHLATSQGLLKARVTLGLLTGHGGEVDLDHPAVMEAYARHLFFRPWLSDRHARAFCGAVDPAIRWREWVERVDTVRHRWCRDRVTSKGYGPRASHNFYSAPVLVRSPVDRTPLLRALAEVDLLPDDTILMAETVARGVELRNGLAMARLRAAALPEPEPWGESAWLQQMRSGPLSAAVLESRREAYRGEDARAHEAMAGLQQTLEETGSW